MDLQPAIKHARKLLRQLALLESTAKYTLEYYADSIHGPRAILFLSAAENALDFVTPDHVDREDETATLISKLTSIKRTASSIHFKWAGWAQSVSFSALVLDVSPLMRSTKTGMGQMRALQEAARNVEITAPQAMERYRKCRENLSASDLHKLESLLREIKNLKAVIDEADRLSRALFGSKQVLQEFPNLRSLHRTGQGSGKPPQRYGDSQEGVPADDAASLPLQTGIKTVSDDQRVESTIEPTRSTGQQMDDNMHDEEGRQTAGSTGLVGEINNYDQNQDEAEHATGTVKKWFFCVVS